jgi:DNA invertase Pin-like site-specific DNA recombinase
MIVQKTWGIHYGRSSSEKQDFSIDQQAAWADRMARSMGVQMDIDLKALRLVRETGGVESMDAYFDDAVQGSRTDRAGSSAFLDRVRRDSRITHVFIWKRNRLSRSEHSDEAAAVENELLRAGKVIVFSDGVVNDETARKSPRAHILAQASDYGSSAQYLFDLSTDVLRGQSSRARLGYWQGGRPPYGFRRFLIQESDKSIVRVLTDRETVRGEGLCVVCLPGTDDESVARLEIVREISRLYFDGFGGAKAVAAELNRRSLPAPDHGRKKLRRLVAGRWTHSTITSILENPCYAGKYVWGRRAEGKHYRYDPDGVEGARLTPREDLLPTGGARKRVERDPKKWRLIDPAVPYEPVVPPEQWWANIARLKERGQQGGQRGVPRARGEEGKYVLRVRCSGCGHVMSGSPYAGKRTYRCSTYMNHGAGHCLHGWIEADLIEGFAVEAVRVLLSDSKNRGAVELAVTQMYREIASKESRTSPEIATLEVSLAELEHRRQRAYRERCSSDPILAGDADLCYTEISAEWANAKKRLDGLHRDRIVSIPDIDAEIRATMALLDDEHARLDKAPRKQILDVFNGLGVEVTLDFEKRKVARRDVVPVAARVRLGCGTNPTPTAPPDPDGPERMCGKVGRGERI